jgi:hypothetical protein
LRRGTEAAAGAAPRISWRRVTGDMVLAKSKP